MFYYVSTLHRKLPLNLSFEKRRYLIFRVFSLFSEMSDYEVLQLQRRYRKDVHRWKIRRYGITILLIHTWRNHYYIRKKKTERVQNGKSPWFTLSSEWRFAASLVTAGRCNSNIRRPHNSRTREKSSLVREKYRCRETPSIEFLFRFFSFEIYIFTSHRFSRL